MANEMKTIKEMSAIPTEKDFVDAIIALQRPAVVHNNPKWDSYVRWHFAGKVQTARRFFFGKLSKVWNEFPRSARIPTGIRSSHLGLALKQLIWARQLIHRINLSYVKLLRSDDCDSFNQCKRLNNAALAFMFTVAMRCIPSLAFLDKVRQLMVDLEDEKADATATHAIFLAKEDCTVPNSCGFDVQNVDDFVDPETLRWIEELGDTPRPQGEQLHLDLP